MPKIVLAWLHPGNVAGAFMDSVLDVQVNGHLAGYIGLESSPRIAEARCELIDLFLARFPDEEWLMMVDSDMTFNSDDIERMLYVADADNKPVIGGLCFAGGRGTEIYPTIYQFTEDGLEPQTDYPANQVISAEATGAAFLLIHRGVLLHMAQPWPYGFGTGEDGKTPNPFPWFAEGLSIKGASIGEDIAFCLKLKQLKIPLHIHTGCKIGHIKTQILTEELYRHQQTTDIQLAGRKESIK
jgi:hypothetical protein